MKFKMIIEDTGDKHRNEEEYDTEELTSPKYDDCDTPEEYAAAMVKYFNNTLQGTEKARKLVSVEIIPSEPQVECEDDDDECTVPKGIVKLMESDDYIMIVEEGCCSKCGKMKFKPIPNFPNLKKCENCYLINVDGFKPPKNFNFRVRKVDGKEVFNIAGLFVPVDVLDDYLAVRLSTGADRVVAHKRVMRSVGLTYIQDRETREKRPVTDDDRDWWIDTFRRCDWFDYFEKWIEAFQDTEQGKKRRYQACIVTCTKCGEDIIPGSLMYGGPGGPMHSECYKT